MIVGAHLLLSVNFGFLVLYFLLDQLFLLSRQIHTVHLSSKLVPCFLLFFVVVLLSRIFTFNVGLDEFSAFPS